MNKVCKQTIIGSMYANFWVSSETHYIGEEKVELDGFTVHQLIRKIGSLGLFWLFGTYLGLGSDSKTFLGLTNLFDLFWFCKYIPIILFLMHTYLGPFFTY